MKSADKTTKRMKRKGKNENKKDLRHSASLRDARVAIVERNVSPDRSVTFSNKDKKVNGSKVKHRKRSMEKASPSLAHSSSYGGPSTAAASSHLLTT